MSIQKKISIILLSGIFLFPSVYSLFLTGKVIIIHWQVEEKLEKESLEIIRILKDEVVWLIAGKEAIIRGEFFDVKSILYEGNTISLKGIFDRKEKEVLNIMNNQSKEQTEKNLQTALWMMAFYTENKKDTYPIPFSTTAIKLFYTNNEDLAFFYPTIPTPPPDFA